MTYECKKGRGQGPIYLLVVMCGKRQTVQGRNPDQRQVMSHDSEFIE